MSHEQESIQESLARIQREAQRPPDVQRVEIEPRRTSAGGYGRPRVPHLGPRVDIGEALGSSVDTPGDAAGVEEAESFARPRDITLPVTGHAILMVSVSTLVSLGMCGLVVMLAADSADNESAVISMGILASFAVLVTILFAAPLRSGRPGSLFCAPDGLHYVRHFRSHRIAWTDVGGVEAEWKVRGVSENSAGYGVYGVCVVRRRGESVGSRTRLIERSAYRRKKVEVVRQANVINAWRLHFVPD